MSEALTDVPVDAPPQIVTLRTLIEQRVRAGQRFHLGEVVAIVVPICTQLAQLHDAGKDVYVHPSSIGAGPDGVPHIVPALASTRPTDPRDRAALAPELEGGIPTARASVFGLGAVVYEMLTLTPVGPGMDAPSRVVPELPHIVDTILAKALLADPAQRPEDLAAFAQAIHHFAPASIAPPPLVDEHAFEVDIDLRSSMLPGEFEAAAASEARRGEHDPLAPVASAPRSAPARPAGAVEELAALKARLEADVSPRWIVVKDKMDHGPFAAIELLQQIASNAFTPDDLLVDTHSGTRTPVKEHAEFSRFAHHAHLKREEVAEQKAVVVAEKREKAAAGAKTTVGLLAVLGVLAVVAVVALKIKASRDEEAKHKQEPEVVTIAGEGSVKKAQAAPKPKVGGGGGGGGGWGGQSYESALSKTVSDMDSETLGAQECAAPIGGDIAAGCGLNGSATAKVYVKSGRAVGVTVTTDPSQPGVNSCMAGRIAGLSWRSVPGGTGCIRTFKVH